MNNMSQSSSVLSLAWTQRAEIEKEKKNDHRDSED